jgi:hypothetical protein
MHWSGKLVSSGGIYLEAQFVEGELAVVGLNPTPEIFPQ